MDPIGRASRSLQGDIGAAEPGLKPGRVLPLYKNTILFPSDWSKDPGPSLARKFLAFFVEKTRFSSKCHNMTSEECIFGREQKRPAISSLFAGRSER